MRFATGMNAAPPHLILLSGLGKSGQTANAISAHVRQVSTQFPQMTGRLSPKCKVTREGAVLVSVECPESLRLSKALLRLIPGAGSYYAEQSPEAIKLTLGRYAGGDVEGFERWLDQSLQSQWDLLPRFRGTCIQLSDEARPFPNPRMPLMGSLATASSGGIGGVGVMPTTAKTTTSTTIATGIGGGFSGFGGFGGIGDASSSIPQRNTNLSEFDAASNILASAVGGSLGVTANDNTTMNNSNDAKVSGSSFSAAGGGLGLGFGGSAWGTGANTSFGGVFSTSPVGGGSGQVGAPGSSFSGGSASSALGGANMAAAAQQDTSSVIGGSSGVVGNKPAPPPGPRPIGVPGLTSGLGSMLISNSSNQQQNNQSSSSTAVLAPPSAPRQTSWASIAKSTAAVVPESASPAKQSVAASRPSVGGIPHPQVPKGPPPPSNLRAFHQQTDPSSNAHSTRPGDWYCENCNAHNFASRNACFKCKEMKKNIMPVTTPTSVGSMGGDNTRAFVPPPPLGNPTAAGAKQAHSIGSGDYSNEGEANGYSHHSGDVSSVLRPGDWLCPSCRAHNFASRTACFKCKARKGGVESGSGIRDEHSKRVDSSDGSSDRGGFPMRSGDWLCDNCGAHNFASRGACFKCKKESN